MLGRKTSTTIKCFPPFEQFYLVGGVDAIHYMCSVPVQRLSESHTCTILQAQQSLVSVHDNHQMCSKQRLSECMQYYLYFARLTSCQQIRIVRGHIS